ncbi:MAG: hypothetical protein V4710_21275 [Verrucomicrobiota bacterium]
MLRSSIRLQQGFGRIAGCSKEERTDETAPPEISMASLHGPIPNRGNAFSGKRLRTRPATSRSIGQVFKCAVSSQAENNFHIDLQKQRGLAGPGWKTFPRSSKPAAVAVADVTADDDPDLVLLDKQGKFRVVPGLREASFSQP